MYQGSTFSKSTLLDEEVAFHTARASTARGRLQDFKSMVLEDGYYEMKRFTQRLYSLPVFADGQRRYAVQLWQGEGGIQGTQHLATVWVLNA